MADYEGMTVNERLFVTGKLKQFDHAANRRDKAKMVEILCSVEIEMKQANDTVDRFLANPAYYGFPD